MFAFSDPLSIPFHLPCSLSGEAKLYGLPCHVASSWGDQWGAQEGDQREAGEWGPLTVEPIWLPVSLDW